MNIQISPASQYDNQEIFRLIESAFANMEESDHKEKFLVERLCHSDNYNPQLSLTAKNENGLIVGYILLTEIKISTAQNRVATLAVAPLAVLPQIQRLGIGGKLLVKAHEIAVKLGYRSAVVLGHKDYYSKFGYKKASDFGIKFPFDAPDECCMVIELVPDALKCIHGTVQYPTTFFE